MESFNDLEEKELYRSAIEDFALDVSPEDNKEALVAAFIETGVTWADYVAQHPEVKPAVEEKVVVAEQFDPNQRVPEPPRAGAVVTSKQVLGQEEEVTTPTVNVQKPLEVKANEQYLIKMTRENPVFETRGHRFTQKHPYALVNGEDYEYIITREDGFRQALPSELSEFYG